MSISDEISRLSGNISDSFGAVEDMGGTVPQNTNSDNLAAAIRSIPQLIHMGTENDYPLSAAHTEYPMGITLIYTASSTSYPYGTGTVVTIRSANARCVQFSFGNTSNSYKLRTADSNGWSGWKTYTGA